MILFLKIEIRFFNKLYNGFFNFLKEKNVNFYIKTQIIF